MATIRAFTTIEQSRRLAEILPLESADMFYPWYIEEDGYTIESGHRITTPNVGNFTTHKANKMILPCWSLASLLSVLNFPSLTQYKEDEWGVCVIDHDNEGYVETTGDNPMDVCVNMIIKLNELNLLCL